jgi:ubiquinone/menaquinone biosynthesis C-methylase UbiE
MTATNFDSRADVWSEWLLHGRHGDNPAYGRLVDEAVAAYARRVIDGAQLRPGMTLVDVGAGEGLVAFQAIDRVGPTLKVVLTDVSATMLEHAQKLATQRGVQGQCSFVECTAERLDAIADASVDVLTTRAVLAYVPDKPAALREFFRILKPGGRISIAEPILQDDALYARVLRNCVDGQSAQPPDRFTELLHRWKAAQFPDTAALCAASPIANYSERDLLSFVQAAGFSDVHLQLHIDVTPSRITSWEVFLRTSPHPWAPPLGRIMAERFTPDERQFFEQILRPVVEGGKSTTTDRTVYVQAQK